ncbi:DUF4411 family protein [Tsuneonella sp. HG249]
MASASRVYSIDTSSLLHAWRRAYPPEQFPGWWAKLDDLSDSGRLVASIEVYHELEKKDDEVFAWAKERKHLLFREIDEDVQDAVVSIMATYPRLVDTRTGKSGGDPFVIAQALALGSSACVLTEEDGGSDKSPKIPHVCKLESLECCNLIQMMKHEGWTFG